MAVQVSADKQDIWLRSIDTAREEQVRTWFTRAGVWRAKSTKGRKLSGEIYSLMAIEMDGQTTITCSCSGWGYRGYCKHAASLALRLDRRGITIRLD